MSGLVGASFAGAYDAIPSIVAAYGMRRLRTAYTGSLLRVRRSSDNTEQDIGYTSTGDLDTAAVAAFVGGGSGYIVTWYDQSSNGYNATQTTAANQPLYVASAQNSRPAMTTDSTDTLSTAAVFPVSTSGYMQAVVRVDTYVSNQEQIGITWDSNNFATINAQVAPSGWRFRGMTSASFSATTFFPASTAVFQMLAQSWTGTTNTAWQPYHNASTKTAYSTTGLMVTGTIKSFRVGASQTIAEIIICNAALSDANRQAAEAAANAYWAVY